MARAQRELHEVMQRATAAVIGLGLPRAAVQTSVLSVRPVYAESESPGATGAGRARQPAEARVVGYRAARSVSGSRSPSRFANRAPSFRIERSTEPLARAEFSAASGIEAIMPCSTLERWL